MIAVSYTILDILYLFGKSVKKNTHRGAIFHRAGTKKQSTTETLCKEVVSVVLLYKENDTFRNLCIT